MLAGARGREGLRPRAPGVVRAPRRGAADGRRPGRRRRLGGRLRGPAAEEPAPAEAQPRELLRRGRRRGLLLEARLAHVEQLRRHFGRRAGERRRVPDAQPHLGRPVRGLVRRVGRGLRALLEARRDDVRAVLVRLDVQIDLAHVARPVAVLRARDLVRELEGAQRLDVARPEAPRAREAHGEERAEGLEDARPLLPVPEVRAVPPVLAVVEPAQVRLGRCGRRDPIRGLRVPLADARHGRRRLLPRAQRQ
mmetsp:Transcript_27797/g.83313  ORF Transcript_27797/g.83313 Transcript_27797/m.83313 type:complete len:251 (+) Transcript_27797:23-775(+)